MEHSIAAKYAARPAARFVRPSSRARQRRLGLRPSGSFHPSPSRLTVLRTIDLGPLVAMRAASRSIRAARPKPVAGPPRPVARMQWTRSARPGTPCPPSAATAPWHG